MTSLPLSPPADSSDGPTVRDEATGNATSPAHKAMWVVLAVLLMATVLYMVGLPVVKERALFEETLTVGEAASVVAGSMEGAELFEVGRVDAAGDFEAFEDGVVPAGVSTFFFRVTSEDGPSATMELEKPADMVIWVDASGLAPGEFTVSAFDGGAAIHRGPDFVSDGHVVFSSTTGEVTS